MSPKATKGRARKVVWARRLVQAACLVLFFWLVWATRLGAQAAPGHTPFLFFDLDPLIALAGRVPADLPAIIRRRPIEVPELLREVNGLTAGQLRAITAQVRRMKQEGSEQ